MRASRLAVLERKMAPPPDANPALDLIRADPTYPMRAAGLTPDPWQARLIRHPGKKLAALCTRRSGKTRTVGCRLAARCLTRKTKVLIFAPTEDQGKELLSYVVEMNEACGSAVPIKGQSETRLLWANGSEVKVKTDRPKSSRGFTPDVVVVDEAAQVSDELWLSVMPMLILGTAEVLLLTTPFGQLGFFYELWQAEQKRQAERLPPVWTTFTVTADECPRVSRAELAHHRATMPARWFRQEYYCEFNKATDAAFDGDAVESMFVAGDEYLPIVLGV